MEEEVISQQTMHKNEYDIVMTKHEKGCDDLVKTNEEKCNALSEECIRKLANERILHAQHHA